MVFASGAGAKQFAAHAALLVALAAAIGGCGREVPPPAIGAAPGFSADATVLAIPAGATPSDDPFDYPIDDGAWRPTLSPAVAVAPGPALPAGVTCMASNNNVAIALHEGRLYLAWRSGPLHFASPLVRKTVISSGDGARTWRLETTLARGADLREPTLLSIGGRLHLHCFEAGKTAISFAPSHVWRTTREPDGRWTDPVEAMEGGEVPWEAKVRRGRACMTSYRGGHYGVGEATVDVHFRSSSDGVTWTDVDPARPAIYSGGVSEVAWELTPEADLWAVTRLEDGDRTGLGAHVASARAGALGDWTFPSQADPERFDSPRMFRHGRDLYVLARRDVGGPFGDEPGWLPAGDRKIAALLAYSARPKRTTLYRLDTTARKLVPVLDLPGCGDTAFPSVARTGPHTFLVANYTSPVEDPQRTWISGQVASDGTMVYLCTITFVRA
jgi:hypothetical protein